MSEKIAGVCSAIAFMLVLMIGIYYSQPPDEVMMRSLVALVLFYILGFVFGEAGSMVVLEKMERFNLKKWMETEGRKLGLGLEGDQIVVKDTVQEPEDIPQEAEEVRG